MMHLAPAGRPHPFSGRGPWAASSSSAVGLMSLTVKPHNEIGRIWWLLMEHFLDSLTAVVFHPLGFVGLLLMAAVWIVLLPRINRLGAIIAELRDLPASKRRYTLERKYKIYPGSSNLPIAFARRRRRWFSMTLALFTVAGAGAMIGTVFSLASSANAARWEIHDEDLTPEGFGYRWEIDFVNPSPDTVLVEKLNVDVLAAKPHSETDRKRPDYLGRRTNEGRLGVLKPGLKSVPLIRPAEFFSLGPGDSKQITVTLEGYHSAHEGWIYDIHLVAHWRVPDQTASFTKLGRTYRVGWPGMPHWSEEGSSAGPGTEPVADPVIAIGEAGAAAKGRM